MTAVDGSGVWSSIADRVESRPGEQNGEGVWSRLATIADPGEFRPQLAPDIEIKEFQQRWGGDYAMIANPREVLHYRLQPGDVDLVRMMDGTRTVREIVVERFKESGELELSGVADLVYMLHSGGFLTQSYLDVDAAVRKALNPSPVRERLRKFVTTQQLEWRGADRVARWGYEHGLKWLLTRNGLLASVVLNVVGFLAFLSLVRSGRFNITPESVALGFLLLTLLNYLIVVVHEWGHALVLIKYGRKVKSAGFMIYFGSPAFYVESADGLMLDRNKRIFQSFAGPYAESLFAAVTASVLWLFPTIPIANILYRFLVLNYLYLFFNLIPLLELDGYWILSDWLQAPDLRPMATSFIRHDLWHKIRTRTHLTRHEVGLALYGFLGVAFTLFMAYVGLYFWGEIFGGLLKSLWRGGPISKVVLILLVALVAGPVIRGLIRLLRAIVRRIRAGIEALRFRLQTKWRVEAAQLIDALPLFDDVPEDVLSELAGRVRLRSFGRGAPVVRQGERAEAFYVVRSGTLQVVEEDPHGGSDRPLRVLGRGEAFGEVGLAEASPRTATVRALEESQVFEIDKSTFDQLLADMVHVPQFAPTLQAVAELKELSCFAHIEPDELSGLLQHGQWTNFAPGETIVEQGETGDAFFAISAGQVDVFEDGTRVRTMSRGSYFGEIALLLDIPRTATVRARTPVRAYRLDREGFDRLIRDSFRRGTLNPVITPDRLWQH